MWVLERKENHMTKKKSQIKDCKRWTYLLRRIITCSSAVWRVYAYGSRDEEDEAVLVNKGTPKETKMLKERLGGLPLQAGCATPPLPSSLPSVCCWCDTSSAGDCPDDDGGGDDSIWYVSAMAVCACDAGCWCKRNPPPS
jgi:hypothetical protein